MDKQRKRLLNLISSSFGILFATAILAISATFAWFANNENVYGNGMAVKVTTPDTMHFKDEITAIRHDLNGDTTTNVYNKSSSGKLILVSSKTDTKDDDGNAIVVVNEFEQGTGFHFDDILPGEYVNITVSFYMNESFDGNNICLGFNGIDDSNGHFTISYLGTEYSHSVIGAYKYKCISAISTSLDGVETDLEFDASDRFMYEYNKAADDEIPDTIGFFETTWSSSYESISVTFQIKEDFSQYYQLVAVSDKAVANALSKKKMSIGSILLYMKG